MLGVMIVLIVLLVLAAIWLGSVIETYGSLAGATAVLAILLSSTIIIAAMVEADRTQLVEIAYDNNVTLPAHFNIDIKRLKLQRYREKLNKG